MSAHPLIKHPGDVRLRLQRLERALVRARLARPDCMPEDSYQLLRYALGLARIERIQVAGVDVAVDLKALAPLQDWLLIHLFPPLREWTDDAESLAACMQAMPRVYELTAAARQNILKSHANEIDAETLDHEASTRSLVSVAGGGGGAGFVYLGAYARLMQDGLAPDYIVGNSIGSVLGLFRAYRRNLDVEELMQFADSLKRSDVFTVARRRADLGLPGLLQLHLKALHRQFVTGDHRRPLRLDELEIPLDLIVSGVRRRPLEKLPKDMQDPRTGSTRFVPLSMQLSTRALRLAQFVSASLVEPLVLGGDPDTAQLHAVDAVGFSAAVPTILQYELRGRAGSTREIYAEIMKRRDFSALVDGGIADNVPARAAWRSVESGRIEHRNAYYLAFDCFHPTWQPKHLWMWPAAKAVQYQMDANRVYVDTMIRFEPTLSPLNIVPSRSALEQAFVWGWSQMEQHMPEVRAMVQPVEVQWMGSRMEAA